MRSRIFKKVHINGLSLILNVNEMKDKQNHSQNSSKIKLENHRNNGKIDTL